jgi:hypothetical protein
MQRKAILSILFATSIGWFPLYAATPSPKTDSLAAAAAPAVPVDTSKHAHTGRIVVATTPASAEVSVDSLAKGQSPVTIDSLAPGQHTIIVKAAGYFGKKVTVDVPSDSTLSLNIALVLPAHLVLTSLPVGAAAVLDDKDIGTTPCDITRIKPGEHNITFNKSGYAPKQMHIVLTEGQTDTIAAIMQQLAPPPVAQQPKTPPANKKFDRMAALIAVGVFVVFGLVLLGVEMHEAAH